MDIKSREDNESRYGLAYFNEIFGELKILKEFSIILTASHVETLLDKIGGITCSKLVIKR